LAAVALLVGAATAVAQTPAARLLPARPAESAVGRGAAPEYKLFDPSNGREAAKSASPPAKPASKPATAGPPPKTKSLIGAPLGGAPDKVFGRTAAPPAPKPVQPVAYTPPAVPAGQAEVYAGPPAYRWYGWGTTTPGANPYAPSGQYPRGSANWYALTRATPGAFPVPVGLGGTQVVGYEPPSYAASPHPLTVASAGVNTAGPFFAATEALPPVRPQSPAPAPTPPRPQPQPVTVGVPPALPARSLPAVADQVVPLTAPPVAPAVVQPVPLVTMASPPVTPQPAVATPAPAPTVGLTWQAVPESRSTVAKFTAVRDPNALANPPQPEPTAPLAPPPAFVPTNPAPPAEAPAAPWVPAKPSARGQAAEPPAPTLDSLVRNACYGLATVTAVRQTGPATLVVEFDADSAADARAAAEAASKLPALKPFAVRYVARVRDAK
jgi:hypothetical protein